MELQILLSDHKTKYKQIYEQIQKAILDRKLPAHAKLSAKRRLAEQLNVSIMTVQMAYEQLQGEGYCYSVERKGYFVSEIQDEWHYSENDTATFEKRVQDEYLINFKNGQVDASAFPYKHWNRLYRKELSESNGSNAPWQGEYSFRVQIAQYLQQARGLACQPEQVYVFSGFQQQLLNVCLFFNRRAIGTEDPGFIRAKSVFEQLQLSCHPISVDEEGCRVPNEPVKLLYLTPAHQYPTGTIMSIARRAELLNWADKEDAHIIEDDYDSEFRYKGAPIPTLSHLDSKDRVLYFGTFSKTLLPSLRISYLVMPASLQQDFEKFNTYQKSTVSRIDQRVAANFMEEGNYTSHIAKMRTLYRGKRNCLIESLSNHLGEQFEIIGGTAGLHITVTLPEGLNESKAIELAKARGVEIDAVSPMYLLHKPNHQVMLGYGAPTMQEIQRGVHLIANVWQDYLSN
ncbi:PLP-dependent aminotransferase family protein [Bacillus sp. ISL-47]|uniref:MocR-like pyridoxine biosynthesis transcription factor PdxR n=1 Tax=Bacillus sp. ISL-47 TaxID=2819130 RepID=UPI001BECCDF8|nr:PLP-dependent aminotransferase family protein [Bacillus sp. ISL-47]MBT2689412.1 PLP-dependent aminotransferase family protein [Bacillus sp. ISL-47]MBT2709864.1 PLP-dependent aminotransferase family protein [Pseudomonas sp. ISL-84]